MIVKPAVSPTLMVALSGVFTTATSGARTVSVAEALTLSGLLLLEVAVAVSGRVLL